MIPRRAACRRRRGAAAIEMALLAPPLCFLAVATVDFGRVFYAMSTISNCARNGAFYASDPLYSSTSPYASIQQAALADAGNLAPAPTVSSSTGTDSLGHAYTSVTVSYPFTTIMTYPGIPSSTTYSRTVQMRVASTTPN
jgi:Flp pilus assembly protein TadG